MITIDDVKKEVLSRISKKTTIGKEFTKRIESTEYIQVTPKQMLEIGGPGEVIALIGSVCYFTAEFLEWLPHRQVCGICTEIWHESFYFSGRNSVSVAWFYRKQPTIDPIRLSEKGWQLLVALDLIASKDTMGEKSSLYEQYKKEQELKREVLQKLKNIPLQDVQAQAFDLLMKLKDCFNAEEKFNYELYRNYLAEVLPKLTMEKVKQYLHRLIIENDTILGESNIVIDNGKLMSVELRTYAHAEKYLSSNLFKKDYMYPTDKYLYDAENRCFLDSKSKEYARFNNSATVKVLKKLNN